jgi:acyl-CoA synthetase (AMP-forming)/AMP-acid ligase II
MHRLERAYGDFYGKAEWGKVADVELTIPALIRDFRAKHAQRELLKFDDERLTYAEADERSARLARQLLAAGIGKGGRIGMCFPNDARFIVTWLAIIRIGAIAVPLSTLSTAAEIRRTARHADLQLLILADGYLSHDYVKKAEEAFEGIAAQRASYRLPDTPYLREVWIWGARVPAWAKPVDVSVAPRDIDAELLAAAEAQVSPADIGTIIYTSGSTADPKGVIHSHGNLMRQGAKFAASYPYAPGDRVFAQLPYFWIGGLTTTLLNAFYTGTTLLGTAAAGTALLDFLERERVSYIIGWPHTLRAMAADPTFAQRDWSAMRGGGLVEALPEALRPRNQIFGNSLGMTESCASHTVSLPDLPDSLRGSLGPPMPGIEQRIAALAESNPGADAAEGEAGELLLRGDTMMLGMVKRERAEVFDADGWYRAGDLCSIRDGHLFFHGRTDDLIKTAGSNVSPREVEQELMALPGIAQANVSGVPDAKRGAVVGAIVVPRPGVTLDPEAIRRDAAKTLASYKVPRVLLILEAAAIPMMSSGKPDRRALLRMLAEAHTAQGRPREGG